MCKSFSYMRTVGPAEAEICTICCYRRGVWLTVVRTARVSGMPHFIGICYCCGRNDLQPRDFPLLEPEHVPTVNSCVRDKFCKDGKQIFDYILSF